MSIKGDKLIKFHNSLSYLLTFIENRKLKILGVRVFMSRFLKSVGFKCKF